MKKTELKKLLIDKLFLRPDSFRVVESGFRGLVAYIDDIDSLPIDRIRAVIEDRHIEDNVKADVKVKGNDQVSRVTCFHDKRVYHKKCVSLRLEITTPEKRNLIHESSCEPSEIKSHTPIEVIFELANEANLIIDNLNPGWKIRLFRDRVYKHRYSPDFHHEKRQIAEVCVSDLQWHKVAVDRAERNSWEFAPVDSLRSS